METEKAGMNSLTRKYTPLYLRTRELRQRTAKPNNNTMQDKINHPFSADVHGISVCIESNNYRFISFVETSMSYFSIDSPDYRPMIRTTFDYNDYKGSLLDGAGCRIQNIKGLRRLNSIFQTVLQHLTKSQRKFTRDYDCSFNIKEKEDARKIGPEIYVDGNSLAWKSREGIELNFEILNQSQLVVHAKYQENRASLQLKHGSDNDNYYNTLMQRVMRYSIYFPIFWLLKIKRGIILLHGGAVEKDGKTLVFIGLNQIGKSSLTIYFSNNGYKFLSDNFLLVDSEGIFAFPDTIRLEQESFIHEHIGSPILKKTDIKIGREQYYAFSDNNVIPYAKPSVIFLLSASNKTEIKGMSVKNAMNKILSINLLVPESIDYSYINLLHWILPQEENIFAKEVEILHSFLSKVDIYELSINHQDNIATVYDKIVQICV